MVAIIPQKKVLKMSNNIFKKNIFRWFILKQKRFEMWNTFERINRKQRAKDSHIFQSKTLAPV